VLKTKPYFVFYHSLELDLICASDDNDHASYKGVKCLGYAWLFGFCFCFFFFFFLCGCFCVGVGVKKVVVGDKK